MTFTFAVSNSALDLFEKLFICHTQCCKFWSCGILFQSQSHCQWKILFREFLGRALQRPSAQVDPSGQAEQATPCGIKWESQCNEPWRQKTEARCSTKSNLPVCRWRSRTCFRPDSCRQRIFLVFHIQGDSTQPKPLEYSVQWFQSISQT